MGDHVDYSRLPKWPTALSDVRKLTIYLALAAAGALLPSLTAGLVPDLATYLTAGVAILGALAIYQGTSTLVKTLAAAGVAALQTILNLVAAGLNWADISAGDWMTVLASALAILTTAFIPDTFLRKEDIDHGM
jgi:hypothetical protein